MGRRLLSFVPGSAMLAGLALLVSSPAARAAGVNDYTFRRTLTLSGTAVFDARSDGRLLALDGANLSVETGVKTGVFVPAGTISGFTPASYGASFLTISPDGTHAAAGSNTGQVATFSIASPQTASVVTLSEFDGVWVDNTRVAISNGNGVDVLNAGTGAVKNVVSQINGASAGVAFDAAGNLYTGNGYDSVGNETGLIKGFSKASFEAAAAGGAALNFQTTGSAIADLLSASPLGFDTSGNLFIGGGDFSADTENGYAAFVNASAVAQASAAGSATPPITSASSSVRKFGGYGFPLAAYNDFTGELYLRDYGSDAVAVYAVPEPNALGGLLVAGVVGLRRRRRAIAGAAVVAIASSARAYVYNPSDFAVEVVAATGLPATTLYNDPASVLGRPTLKFNNGTAANPAFRRAKLIEGVYNTGLNGEKLITTVATGQSITVRMGRPVTNDPSHPYGVDFNVFGNSFYSAAGGGTTSDTTNLNVATLSGPTSESVLVSVSPDNVNWYSYTNGPTGDGAFPTNSYRWDRASAAWSDDETDPTKAVNPAYRTTLAGMTGADALDLYAGSAGGAGFDLAESGFASIQYVRFDGNAAASLAGEIDAVAVVPEPGMLGLAVLVFGVALRRSR